MSSAEAGLTSLGDQVLERLRTNIAAEGLEAIVATSPEGLAYTAVGASEAVVVALEAPLMRERLWVDTVTAYAEFEQHPMEATAEALERAGLADGRVGVERTALSQDAYERLARALPAAELVGADGFLARQREIKTSAEIEAIRDIGVAAQRIAEECCALVGPGDTEHDLAGLITERFTAAGGDELTMLVVASGERSAHPNGPPTHRALGAGEIVRLDIIGTKANYYCDVARTAVVGEPSDEQRRVYQLLSDVHERALEAIRPGVQSEDVYRIYFDAMERSGLPPYHFLGHGLGITLHEEPFVRGGSSVPLQEGMVLCIEPLTFVEGSFGIQIEDEVLVTADGCEPITRVGDLLTIAGAS
jgi:Xaa-Pro dipeptidase